MIKASYTILLFVFCFSVSDICAQASGKGKQKKAKSIKNAPEEEEKIEEIVEDQAISTKTVNTGIYPIPDPIKKFDTTLAPNDALTAELQKLVDDSKMVNIALEASATLITNNLRGNISPEMEEFYKRFQAFIKTEEVTRFYNNLFIKIYRKYYTIEEVRELRKFYQTEVGKKSIQLMNTVMQESMEEGEKFGEYWGQKVFIDMSNEKNK